MSFDASELDVFAAELGAAGRGVRRGVNGAVFKGATNVKRAFNESFYRSRSFKGVGGSVDFDIEVGPDSITADIGPNPERFPGAPGPAKVSPSAGLAGVAIFGGASGGGGKVADPQVHLDAEEAGFIAALDAVIERTLP